MALKLSTATKAGPPSAIFAHLPIRIVIEGTTIDPVRVEGS
jgi:hypothetical protein